MPDIRYVIFSDMHLGAENSILTNLKTDSWDTDTSVPSPVMIKMIECLKNIISKNEGAQKPKLVLNGDIMELALTTTNNSAMAFQRFIELLMPSNGEQLFNKKIIYSPGNHDHNLWERSRFCYFTEYLKQLNPGEEILEEIYCTRLINPPVVAENLLNAIIQRYPHLKDVFISAVYPALAIISDDKQKCVVFCHGHYIESMYALMTNLRSRVFPDRDAPHSFEELEKENYAWVDFFWSALGRSGSVGKDINLIYDKLQDPQQVKQMLLNITRSHTAEHSNKIRRWIEQEILQEILGFTIGRLAANERNEPNVELTPDATLGLKKLMEIFLLNGLKAELNGNVPANISFVFGHTHKPFQKLIEFEGYSSPVKIYNSGGWVVDTMHQQPLHGGSVILVDEHFDVVALQMYKEGKYHITLEELNDVNEKSCDFYKRINSIINMSEEPWFGFGKVVETEVNLRYKNLAGIANSNN